MLLYKTCISIDIFLKMSCTIFAEAYWTELIWKSPGLILSHTLITVRWQKKLSFMQDGATPHTTRISHEFLTSAAIDVLLSCNKSPDMNTIEDICSVTVRRINGMNPIPGNAVQLLTASKYVTLCYWPFIFFAKHRIFEFRALKKGPLLLHMGCIHNMTPIRGEQLRNW